MFAFLTRPIFRFVGVFLLVFSTSAFSLDCQSVKQLVATFLKMHFSHHTFNDELSRRTLDNYLRAWDSGKVFFLEADIEQFKKKYSTKLDDLVLSADCSGLNDIVNVYSKRFKQAQGLVNKHIAGKHDFTVDEYMVTDRKKLKWAKTTEEIEDRWRKRVKFQLLQLKSGVDDEKKAKEKLTKRYDLIVKRHNELTSKDFYAIFLNAFSSALDPHSEYLSIDQLEDFRISTRLSLEGIGAVLRSEEGFTTIQSLVPGGAAWKTGQVKEEDKILAVAQGEGSPVDVIDMDLREVVKLIRGTRGTEVRLTLLRNDKKGSKKFIVPIIREKIQLKDREAKSQVFEVKAYPGKDKKQEKTYRVGVIDLPSFYIDFEGRENNRKDFKSSSRDLAVELEKLRKEKVHAVVIDLRNNGGGSLDESISVAGLFFDEGPVVQIRGLDNRTFVQSDKDGLTLYDGPLLVMINRHSASASEIFAGAISDYERGLIIGDKHTFGKGTVQNLNNVSGNLGAIKVTISKFYRPSGGSTQHKGVEADIVLPSYTDEFDIGEKYYDYGLPWDQIEAAKFKKFNYVKSYVARLKKASRNRVAEDEGFKELATDLKKYRDSVDERGKVSLKEKPELVEGKDGATKKEIADEAGLRELDEDDDKINLKDDLNLQETLRIAVDYVHLLRKEKLKTLEIPGLAKVQVAENNKPTKKDENKPAKPKK